MSSIKVMIIADDLSVVRELVDTFIHAGMMISVFDNNKDAVEKIRTEQPDFVILDIIDPDQDGVQISKQVRQFSDVPIMILTANIDESDLVNSLNVGADDYICKPYYPREVVAKVKIISRRGGWLEQKSEKRENNQLIYRSLVLDSERYLCHLDGQRVDLTAVEFRLLLSMLKRPGVIFSREELFESAHVDKRRAMNARTVDNHIKNLRKKLIQVSNSFELIHSIYGVGYKAE